MVRDTLYVPQQAGVREDVARGLAVEQYPIGVDAAAPPARVVSFTLRNVWADVVAVGLIHWHVDASFAVHADMKIHTGGSMSLGRGSIVDTLQKQKLN